MTAIRPRTFSERRSDGIDGLECAQFHDGVPIVGTANRGDDPAAAAEICTPAISTRSPVRTPLCVTRASWAVTNASGNPPARSQASDSDTAIS